MSARSLASLIFLVPTLLCCAQDGPVRTTELRDHVRYLASDELAGRETGQPGIARAEEYIAAAFAQYGLRPLPDEDDFFVDLTLYRHSWDRRATTLEIDRRGARRAATLGVDFRPFGFSDTGVVEAEVVFAGYGITAEEHDWDDYAGLEVGGKIVLVLRHEPLEADPASSFDGTRHTDHAHFEAKARNARRHGARAMLLVTDPLHHDHGDDLHLGDRLRLEPIAPEETADEPFLSVHVSRELTADLLGDDALEDLQRAVDEGRSPSELAPKELRTAGARMKLRVTLRRPADEVAARNVAALLAGTDPDLRDQWIVIGGHHDHIGTRDTAADNSADSNDSSDRIFNGADDNASGTAGILALARAFAARAAAGEGPRRSLVFITFTAEERGLLGSRAMVEQQRLPVDRIVFMLNLDMIGRNPGRDIRLIGDDFSDGFRQRVEEANDGIGLDFVFSGGNAGAGSDHQAFHGAGIPFLFPFTGTHEDYHRLGDHADKLDYERMRDILNLCYRLLDGLASSPRMPTQ